MPETTPLIHRVASSPQGALVNAYLIETGRLVIKGPWREIRDDESVRRSYVGY